MIAWQAELHNVEAMVEIQGRPGYLLQRVPEAVREGLTEGGRQQIRRAALTEIRFVAEGGEAQVTLASYGEPSAVQIYYGDYWVEDRRIGEQPETLTLGARDPRFQFDSPWREGVPRSSFGPVWRILVHGGEVHLLELRGASLRPPRADEKPALRYLAYGTSITYGGSVSSPDATYVAQAAWRLGLDPLNLGVPGAAHCEPAIAAHIAGRRDWDIATLCLSVNMLNQGATADEFAARAGAMVSTIVSANPDKPVLCIGLFTGFPDLGWTWPGREVRATSEAYRQALRSIVEDRGFANLGYADGSELLDDWRGLSHDLLHPGTHGMIRIGERLAERMRPMLSKARER
ncbi:GDSL-type esterase/lipase family protein [Cohnella sp. GCM10012308]|uniref:GDSL-type esterase/lipase family protein n=1 Tax=Cohnella sp. GCM10012308 TaxID=3317329 RepID=UPI0036120229